MTVSLSSLLRNAKRSTCLPQVVVDFHECLGSLSCPVGRSNDVQASTSLQKAFLIESNPACPAHAAGCQRNQSSPRASLIHCSDETTFEFFGLLEDEEESIRWKEHPGCGEAWQRTESQNLMAAVDSFLFIPHPNSVATVPLTLNLWTMLPVVSLGLQYFACLHSYRACTQIT